MNKKTQKAYHQEKNQTLGAEPNEILQIISFYS